MFSFNLKKPIDSSIDKKIVENIRALSIDMIQEAKSGHPGIALGAAPIMYTLFAKHLNINPKDDKWFNRDRFILSAGHGSSLLYATLFMAGFPISMDDLKNFRKINSITPGHPEYKITPGVEMSTGPLGQGVASSVGMAMAEEYLRAFFNSKKASDLVNHYTYVLCGDGDLMEGVSYEALSLAGHLKLNKLIILYDANNTTLDGSLDKSFSENIEARFNAIGFNVLNVLNGEDILEIDKAITTAKSSDKPTLIKINTIIGKFSKHQGTSKIHGAILDEEDFLNVKNNLNVREIPFTVSNDAITSMQEEINERVNDVYNSWQKKYKNLDEEVKELVDKLSSNDYKLSVAGIDYTAPEDQKEATRVTSGLVLNSLAKNNPFLLSGAGDISGSTKTYLNNLGDFTVNDRSGRNIWFGVREHAMASIQNGMSLMGLRMISSTFLAFSDYMKPAIRLAALMNLPNVYIFTHDSVQVGEDGPTHQPIEQLAMLRSIPNLEVYRPGDANEVIGVYKTVMTKKEGPSAIILSRQDAFVQTTTSTKDVNLGAYILKDALDNLNGIIIATGTEIDLALKLADSLEAKGLGIRVISMPCVERFLQQSDEYKEQLLPLGVKTFVIEPASSLCWHRFVYNDKYLITLDQFGKSGESSQVLKELNYDFDSIYERIEKLLK